MRLWTIHPLQNGCFSVRFRTPEGTDLLPPIENIPSTVFALCSQNQTILVDAGFRTDHIPGPGSSGCQLPDQMPQAALKEAGIDPGTVTDILLTHLHWDHTAGLAAFPRANIHIQADEFRYLRHLKPNEETYYRPLHWMDALDRFHFTDGDHRFCDGIQLIRTGHHTPGHQAVLVATKIGTIALAGDLPFDYSGLWAAFPQSFWDHHRQNEGKQAWWKQETRQTLFSWMETHHLTGPPDQTTGPTLSLLRKKADRVIVTHDPSLRKESVIG